jgi:hypothetical protein
MAGRTENRYYRPEAITDAQGNFTLRFIGPGRHLIQAGRYAFRKGEEPKGSYAPVALRAGETKQGIQLVGFRNRSEITPPKKYFLFEIINMIRGGR